MHPLLDILCVFGFGGWREKGSFLKSRISRGEGSHLEVISLCLCLQCVFLASFSIAHKRGADKGRRSDDTVNEKRTCYGKALRPKKTKRARCTRLKLQQAAKEENREGMSDRETLMHSCPWCFCDRFCEMASVCVTRPSVAYGPPVPFMTKKKDRQRGDAQRNGKDKSKTTNNKHPRSQQKHKNTKKHNNKKYPSTFLVSGPLRPTPALHSHWHHHPLWSALFRG